VSPQKEDSAPVREDVAPAREESPPQKEQQQQPGGFWLPMHRQKSLAVSLGFRIFFGVWGVDGWGIWVEGSGSRIWLRGFWVSRSGAPDTGSCFDSRIIDKKSHTVKKRPEDPKP
jgi:hypothetical protein